MDSIRLPTYLRTYDQYDDRLLFVIKFFIAPIGLFLHISINYIINFSYKRQKYKNAFYRFVLVISCTDIYWCHYELYQAFCGLNQQCPFSELFNIIITNGAQYMFFLCMNMDLCIAINRFSAVVLHDKHEKLFGQEWGWYYPLFFIVASGLETLPTLVYNKKYYVAIQEFTYVNPPSEGMAKIIMWFELGCTYVAHVIMVVLYIWSFLVYRHRLRTTKVTVAQMKEGRLLIQAVFSGIPCFVMMTFHHLVPLPIVELAGEIWCLFNGPFVYLWFNQEIRNDWLILMGLKSEAKVVPYYVNTFIKMKHNLVKEHSMMVLAAVKIGVVPHKIGPMESNKVENKDRKKKDKNTGFKYL